MSIDDLSLSADDAPSMRVGDLLRQAGLVTLEQTEEIAGYRDAHGVRFGEAAVALGLVDQRTIDEILAFQFDARGREADGEGGHMADEIAVVHMSSSRAAEDYRSLRNALALRWFKAPAGQPTLAVVSATRGDGRSLVCANLAACFAQVGMRTLLVDADMRNPRQHKLFNLDDRYGLSSYLAGRAEDAAFYRIAGLPSLAVMPAGGLPPNPQELLLRSMLPKLVADARRNFEVVIFDTPSASIGTDYQLIGAETEGALLVTSRQQTRVREAAKMVNRMKDSGIRIVGSTMTGDV